MQFIPITAAEFSFVGMPDEMAEALSQNRYAFDFAESFNNSVRDIGVRSNVDVQYPDSDHKVVIEISGKFNSVAFYIELDSVDAKKEERVEIYRADIDQLIPPTEMHEAVKILEIEQQARKLGNPQAITAADMARSYTHTQITQSLTEAVNSEIPVLLQDHSNEQRGLAGVIRQMKYYQNNGLG